MNEPGPIGVLIVNDHPVVRQGLALILSQEPDIALVGSAGTSGEALQLLRRHQPDIVSHHLAWLFEQAQVSLGAKDVGILERLQSFLDKARYPEETTPARETGDEVAQVLHLLTRLEDTLAVSRPEKVLPRISLFGFGLPSS